MRPRFGLYIHWPFCAAKCPYCDFNSHVAREIDHARWGRNLRAELARVASETPDHILTTIFFGGGTPSLMPADLVAALIEDAKQLWRASNDLEVTLEANPTSIEAGRFRAFRLAGVNRVSIGVQALNNKDLRKLGRMHSAEEALHALEIARETFDRVSIDLIYARQDQSAQDWEKELSQAISLELDHLSLYQLTVEPGTDFAKRHKRGKLKGLPSEDLSIELWDLTQEITKSAGLAAYETSNHARPGAQSRHNLLYWSGGDWAAIGPGAHGRITIDQARWATETALAPAQWLRLVEETGSGETFREKLTRAEEIDEAVLMGLRLHEGLDLTRMKGLGWHPDKASLKELSELGYAEQTGNRLIVTDAGKPLLNAVISKLLA
ncbi:MAG: radical SAM family heme chaperone HemW [Pseudomonadota bacterium]